MKDEGLVKGLAIGAILVQWYFMYTSGIIERQLPFSTELLSAETAGGNITMILYVVIPLPFMLWVFSGKMESIISGYGRLYIIRNYSRQKLFLKEIGKMGVGIVLFQGFTWVVYQGASSEQWEPLTMAVQIRVMVMYTLMLAGTVLLQYFLELLTGPACSQITVLVYYTSSLFLYDLAQNTAVQRIFAMVFFPNLGFAMRNGAMETENLRLFCCSLAELLAICTILFFISLKVVNKRDIM